MGGQDQGDAEQVPQDAAAEMRVPGMAMDDIARRRGARHHHVARQGVHKLGELGVLGRQGEIGLDSPHRDGFTLRLLIAETQDIHGIAGYAGQGLG
jgi:hypothetical protein